MAPPKHPSSCVVPRHSTKGGLQRARPQPQLPRLCPFSSSAACSSLAQLVQSARTQMDVPPFWGARFERNNPKDVTLKDSKKLAQNFRLRAGYCHSGAHKALLTRVEIPTTCLVHPEKIYTATTKVVTTVCLLSGHNRLRLESCKLLLCPSRSRISTLKSL